MFRLLAIILVPLLVCLHTSYSFAREQAFVKVTPNEKYTRVFFYSKQPGAFSAAINGNKLKITFKNDIAIDASAIAALGYGDINNASFDAASNTAIITLAGNSYSVRKFTSEDFVGVDILKPTGDIAENKNVAEPGLPSKKERNQGTKIAGIIADEPVVEELSTRIMPEPVILRRIVEKPRHIAKPKLKPQVRHKLAKNDSLKKQNPEVIARLQAIEPAADKVIQLAQVEPAATADTTRPGAEPVIVEKSPEPAVENENETSAVVPKTEAADNIEETAPEDITPVEASAPAEVNPVDALSAPLDDKIDAVGNTGADANVAQDAVQADKNEEEQVQEQPAIVENNAEPKVTSEAETDDLADMEDTEGESGDAISDAIKKATPEAIVASFVNSLKDSLLAKITFNWNETVAASVFKRAGYLWIVFDKSQEVDIDALIKTNSQYFASGEQMKNRFYTILRLKLISDINIVSYKDNENWVVGILKDKVSPPVVAAMDMKFSDLIGSKVLLDSESPLKPLRLIDDEVGDEIVVFPFKENGTGFKEPYQYIDFAFIETAQGAVMHIISDDVDVAVVDTGVEVAGPSNRIANASQSALKELRQKEEELARRAARLKEQNAEVTALKFTTWMIGGPKAFKRDLKELEWKIVESDWSDKSEHRLALARFYLVHGFLPEALGTISIMKEYDEKASHTNDVKIVEATALYLLGRYSEALDVYKKINVEELSVLHRGEIDFWRKAAELQISNIIKEDKFITKNPLDKSDEEEGAGLDQVGNTKLMRDTSTRLLKLIRKMDPEFVNAEELQKLEATARFVTNHYQEAIRRFEETELYSSGDIFQAEDNKLWWSASTNKRSDADELPLLPNIKGFLKNYPDAIFNDFALLAVEDELKRNDLAKAEEILVAFRDESRLQQKDSIEFFRGLYYAKNEEDDKAISTWEALSGEVFDPYNRARSQFAKTVFELSKNKIDAKQAIVNLNKVRDLWRGGQLEFHILNILGEFYMETKQPMEGFKVWREAISAFPGSDESLLIAKKMSDKFVKIFSQGEADSMSQIDAITLYYEFRELTPIGKLGDEMITKLVDRLVNVDLLARATALLTHQVRFRLVGEERDVASTKLVKIHLMNHSPQQALDVLDATDGAGMTPEILLERRYLRAQALLALGKSNKVLALLQDDYSKDAAFLRADVYWHNGVWRKVIDELEVPFREIRREERKLALNETNQVIKLAVAYALIERQKRLQILYEDFSGLINDGEKKNLLTFIATNKGPVDYRNLEKTVEFKEMEDFLNNYMKLRSEPAADATSPSAQAAGAVPAG